MSTIRATYIQHGSSSVPNITLNASGEVILASGIISSGTFAFTSGTASVPGIAVSGDADTGIYSPAANKIAITTSGTERLIVDDTGKVGIGTTSPTELLTVGSDLSTDSYIRVNSANNTEAGIKFYGDLSAAKGFNLGYEGNGNYFFIRSDTSGTVSDRLVIDDSGKVGIGTTSPDGSLHVHTASAGTVTPWVNADDLTVESDGATGISILAPDNNQANLIFGSPSDNIGSIIRWSHDDNELQVGTHKSDGFLTFKTAIGSERMRITNSGAVLIAKTSEGLANSGSEFQGGLLRLTRSAGGLAELNRLTDDGELIGFWQAGAKEGSISVSGTTVSYNGAHLSRWSQLVGIDPYDKTARPEILRGTVMSNLDEMCDWTCPTSGDCQDNEQLNKTEISSVDDDSNVAGVFQSWDDDDDTWVNDFYLAMTGDFVIRIAAGTTVQRGDLLCSAGDGTARPQGDRYIKDSTIAKVTSTTVSCTHPDGSYCVPCVLMAC